MVVVANVEEVDIGTMKVGDPVAMTFNAYPNSTYTGKVTVLPAQASTTSSVTTYPVVVSLIGPTTGLSPGMTANLTIVTSLVQNAMLVPNLAVTTTSFGSYVTTAGSCRWELSWTLMETGHNWCCAIQARQNSAL
jgi:HlyD family secretion protein